MTLDQVYQDIKTEQSPQATQQQCPKCQAIIPVYRGYKTWCDKCGWNLEIPDVPPYQTLFEKLYRSISQKSSQHLLEEMLKSKSLEITVTPARALAFLIAGCVHSITLAFVVLGIWLCVFAWSTARFLGILLGIFCFALVWLMLLPRPPKAAANSLPREQFPTLYQVTDRIAQALSSPPADEIMYDLKFNAAFGQFGWRRKCLLILGLPLFSILNGPEIVALLSHELAHNVNGDPNRSLFLSSALYSLTTWYQVIHPQNRWHINVGLAAPLMVIVNLISLPIAGLIWLVGYALSHLLWYDVQRAEYLADLLAATVSGTDAQMVVLDKVLLNETFRTTLKFWYIDQKDQDFFADLRRRITQIPSRELERIRQIEKLDKSRIDITHPSTAHRVEFLKANYIPEAKVVLSKGELAQLEQELEPLLQRIQKRILALDELSFRELFGIRW